MGASKKIAAILTFFPLAGVGVFTVFSHLSLSGADKLFENACPVPPTYTSLSQRHYTNFVALDAFLCSVVEFFKFSLLPANLDFTLHFLTGLIPMTVFYLIEGTRTDRSRLIIPLIIGLGYVVASGALFGCITGLLLALRMGNRQRGQVPLTQTEAESVFLAITLGYIIPTIAFFIVPTEYVLAYWQGYPILMSILQNFWLSIRPASRTPAYNLTRMTLVISFVISMSAHIYYLIAHWSSNPITDFIHWWPSFSVPDPQNTTFESGVFHLLQWDAIVFYSSSILGLVFLEDSFSEALVILLLAPLASIVISPGGCIALLAIRREQGLMKRAAANAVKKVK